MKTEAKSVTIVLLGRFAPDKFSLAILAEGKVIPQKAAETASVMSLLPGLQVQLKFPWGELFVRQDRFQVGATEPPYIRICDFCLKAINDLNPQAIVTAFGINCDMHVDTGSRQARNALGVRLAPPDAWGDWGADIRRSMQTDDSLEELQGGVAHIQMRQRFKDSGVMGWLDVSTTPSPVIPNNTGVLLRANHHHQASIPDSETGDPQEEPTEKSRADTTAHLLAHLSERFENSISTIDAIFKGVLSE